MNIRRICAGLLFAATGAVLGIISFETMTMGTPSRMGPGFFPVVLCALLVLLGAGMVVQGAAGQGGEAHEYAPLRAIVLISLAPIAFGLLVRPAGLVISLFVTALMSTLARRDGRLASNLAIAAGLTAVCVAIFEYGIGLSVPLFPSM